MSRQESGLGACWELAWVLHIHQSTAGHELRRGCSGGNAAELELSRNGVELCFERFTICLVRVVVSVI